MNAVGSLRGPKELLVDLVEQVSFRELFGFLCGFARPTTPGRRSCRLAYRAPRRSKWPARAVVEWRSRSSTRATRSVRLNSSIVLAHRPPCVDKSIVLLSTGGSRRKTRVQVCSRAALRRPCLDLPTPSSSRAAWCCDHFCKRGHSCRDVRVRRGARSQEGPDSDRRRGNGASSPSTMRGGVPKFWPSSSQYLTEFVLGSTWELDRMGPTQPLTAVHRRTRRCRAYPRPCARSSQTRPTRL